MGEATNSYKMLVDNTELSQYFAGLSIGGRIILKLTLKNRRRIYGRGLIEFDNRWGFS
jgi:hypothetical protein